MVTNVHPIFSYPLKGPFFHQPREGDRVLLRTSHHQHSEKSRVEITHVLKGGVPLVEGSPMVDNRLGGLWTRDLCVHRWTVQLHWLNIRAQHHPHLTWVSYSKSGYKGPVSSRLRRSLPENLVNVERSSSWSSVLQCCRGLFESTLAKPSRASTPSRARSGESTYITIGLF